MSERRGGEGLPATGRLSQSAGHVNSSRETNVLTREKSPPTPSPKSGNLTKRRQTVSNLTSNVERSTSANPSVSSKVRNDPCKGGNGGGTDNNIYNIFHDYFRKLNYIWYKMNYLNYISSSFILISFPPFSLLRPEVRPYNPPYF